MQIKNRLIYFIFLPILTLAKAPPSPPAHLSAISVLCSQDYAPFTYLDQDQNPQGLFIDIWKLWSRKTGITVNFFFGDFYALHEIRHKGLNPVSSGFFKNREREKFMDFSLPFYSITSTVFFDKKITGIKDFQDLSGFKVGVMAGDFIESHLRSQMPHISLVPFPTYAALVKAAAEKKVRIIAGDLPAIYYHLYKLGVAENFKELPRPLLEEKVYSAVNKGNRALLEIINKGLEKITPEEITAIKTAWEGQYLPVSKPWKELLAISLFMLLILLVFLFWNKKLKKHVKKATSQLLDKENKYQVIFNSVNDAIFIHDTDGKILDINEQAASMLGFNKEEFLLHIQKEYTQYSVGQNFSLQKANEYVRLAASGFPQTFEWATPHKNGSFCWTEVSLKKATIEGEDRVIATVRDISERKKHKDILEASLKEKEILLKELHHRVRNNLQIISGLLYLQASSINDPLYKTALRESHDRINSIALIHKTIYDSENFSRVDMSLYFKKLAQELSDSYPDIAPQITLDFQLQKVFLDIEQAIPVGLIFNELLSNSFKYAFHPNQKGLIQILSKLENSNVFFYLSDNGMGLPPDFEVNKSQNLGFLLINAMVEQLHSLFTVEKNNPGAAFSLRFPILP
ncbi:MAG: hypothetical protein CVV50_00655 [Spirochaetae bacterium HGW-Spirochaetae-6]|nr:MAG: hypothetical protein CVV50_00655 [Spirochaetae bacterium HGW-Spirochaetae-6]